MKPNFNLRHIAAFYFCFLGWIVGCNSPEEKPLLHHKALLASRFDSVEALSNLVQFDFKTNARKESTVTLKYGINPPFLLSVLADGISEHDILDVRQGNALDKIGFTFKHPFAIRNREDLATIYMMARRRFHLFGEGDVAFYDFATTSVDHIQSFPDACQYRKDSSEKGFINTFNHVTAQAFSTTLFSEELADFIGDVHELKNMPELTTGIFSKAQLYDTLNFPVDNYIDMVNNEIGQELGKALKKKYAITVDSRWTPNLLSNYLNDLQSHYAWSFGIRMTPYAPNDDLVVRFCKKLNAVLDGKNH